MATSPCAHRLHAVVFFSLLIVERILQLTGFASTSSRDGSRGSPSSSCVWCVALLSPFTCVVCVLVACEIINTELWCCFIFCGSFCAASQYRDRRQSSGIFSTRWMIGVGDGIEECWKRRCNYERWMMVSRTCCRKVELTRADLIAKPGSKVRNSYD